MLRTDSLRSCSNGMLTMGCSRRRDLPDLPATHSGEPARRAQPMALFLGVFLRRIGIGWSAAAGLTMSEAPIVPIIGGGPAGMSCALWLHNYGLKPVIIEQADALGGMARLSPYPNAWLLGER